MLFAMRKYTSFPEQRSYGSTRQYNKTMKLQHSCTQPFVKTGKFPHTYLLAFAEDFAFSTEGANAPADPPLTEDGADNVVDVPVLAAELEGRASRCISLSALTDEPFWFRPTLEVVEEMDAALAFLAARAVKLVFVEKDVLGI
jgi:hypothetical protein